MTGFWIILNIIVIISSSSRPCKRYLNNYFMYVFREFITVNKLIKYDVCTPTYL